MTGPHANSTAAAPVRVGPLVVAAFVSGAAALVYEVLWVRHLGSLFGATAVAVNVVLGVFFGGIGVGAFLFGRLADRMERPLRLFIALELSIAVSGLLFWPVCRLLDDAYLSLAPAEWSFGRATLIRAAIATALLAVPTTCMGGTIPALVRHLDSGPAKFGRGLALIYGANTVGAALGALASIYVLVPAAGLRGAAWVAAAANVVAIALVSRSAGSAPKPPASALPPGEPDPGARLILVTAGVTGFLSVGLEVLWTRALTTRLLASVYSFATILTAYLLCLGVGSLIAAALDRRGLIRRETAAVLVTASGVAALASTALLARMPAVDLTAGSTPVAMFFGELGRTLGILSLPILLFGCVFPVLGRLLHRTAGAGRTVGSLYLANTVGSVAAPLLFGFLVIPTIGLARATMLVGWSAVVFGLAVLAPWAGALRTPRANVIGVATVGLAALFSLATRGDVVLWRSAPDDKLLYSKDGVAASVTVVQTATGNRVLKIDNSYHLGASRTAFAQARQGLLPLLVAPAPDSALFIGLATGGSAGPGAAFGGVATDIVEIVPGLAPTLPLFADTNANLAARLASDPRTRLLEVDGRHFVRATDRRYDVVVGDLFVPWRAGEGAMYALEHFRAVRSVLERDGLFCQWLPLYQLRLPELQTVVATFCAAFENVEAVWLYLNVDQPVVGLIGSQTPLALDAAELRDRAAKTVRRDAIAAAGLDDATATLALWIAGREALTAWASGAPIETRDRPTVEFASPGRRFATGTPPAADNVLELLELALAETGDDPARPDIYAQSTPDDREAIRRYRRAVAHFFRGAHAETFGARRTDAVAEWKRALTVTPDWAWIAWNLGNAFEAALGTGDWATALAAAQALEVSPAYRFLGLHYAGIAHLRSGSLDAARASAEAAGELEPDNEANQALQREIAAARDSGE